MLEKDLHLLWSLKAQRVRGVCTIENVGCNNSLLFSALNCAAWREREISTGLTVYDCTSHVLDLCVASSSPPHPHEGATVFQLARILAA